LGWFQDGGTNIEEIMREKGLAVTRVKHTAEHQHADDAVSLLAEDSVFEALAEPIAKQ
jgi:hypothetical protein